MAPSKILRIEGGDEYSIKIFSRKMSRARGVTMLLCGGRKFDLKVLLVTEILKHAALFFLLLFLKIPKTVFLEVVY